MESTGTLRSPLFGSFLWLPIYALFSLFTMFVALPSDAPLLGNLEGGVNITKQLSGLGMGCSDGSLPQCLKLEDTESLALESEGDVVIGGFFPLHYLASMPQNNYSNKPQLTTCSR